MEDALALLYNLILCLGFLLLCTVMIVKKTVNRRLWIVRLLFFINTLTLLPCAYVTVINIRYKITGLYFWPWTRSFLGFILPVVFLRCFYLPYICTAVFAGIYIFMLRKYRYPKKDVVTFILLFLICVLGLVSVEEVFHAAMSV